MQDLVCDTVKQGYSINGELKELISQTSNIADILNDITNNIGCDCSPPIGIFESRDRETVINEIDFLKYQVARIANSVRDIKFSL
jgi:hypothetical protein